MTALPRVAVSLGDPTGIGPEVTVRALCDPSVRERLVPVVFGDPGVWRRAVELTGADPGLAETDPEAAVERGGVVAVTRRDPAELPYGAIGPVSGRTQLAFLEAAADALVAGRVDALCTAPVTKAAIVQVVPGFVGHTEYLAARFGVPVVMMLAGPRLRVALVTTHLALSEVPPAITRDAVVATVRRTHAALRDWFGIGAPRIAVCGLNPHAGEGGRFGSEDRDRIAPAVRALAEEGLDVVGPLAADGALANAARGAFDAVVAMYHDQGLGAVKTLEFDEAVNVTLGLPRPRTSPDHGSALDIAGTGRARPDSMVSALRLAAGLAGR